MTKRYHLDEEQAAIDYRNLAERVLTLVETPDLDPVTFLDFERHTPFKGHISAPYRLDCALTYRLPEGVDPAFAPTHRVERELTTAEWRTILDKAWAAGIPQIILTGGEPTLRDDLALIIARAEENGQVTGLITLGHDLANPDYLKKLLQTGLDHMMLVLDPDDQVAWKALDVALPEDIFIAVHLILDETNADQIEITLRKLAEIGVHAVSLSATKPELETALQAARDLAASLQLEMVWDLPVPYSQYNPISLELENGELPEAAGRAWLYVEPDGDVLPTQGYNQVLGNLLSDPWEKVWKVH